MTTHNNDETGVMPVSEYKLLTRQLVQLEDADLGEWDRLFFEGLRERVIKFERRVRISGAQQRQLDRITEQHL